MIFPNDYGVAEAIPRDRGERREIAVLIWSPISGRAFPVMFQILDENREIKTFKRLRPNLTTKREYAGIIYYEFDCNVMVEGLNVNVLMQFFPDSMKWYLLEI